MTNEHDVLKREQEDLKEAKISREQLSARRRIGEGVQFDVWAWAESEGYCEGQEQEVQKVYETQEMKLKAYEQQIIGDLGYIVGQKIEAKRARAEERIPLGHKNTSKSMKRQLQRNAKLKRHIRGGNWSRRL